jgi:hypothetical protein
LESDPDDRRLGFGELDVGKACEGDAEVLANL